MTVSRFVVGLLLISSVSAFWRLPCAKPVVNARLDPIVSPGKASGHSHTVMGSGAIGLDTTFADLRKSNCSTCKVKDDQSAYWIPELYYEYKNGSYERAEHGGMLVYYIQRFADGETVVAIPDGLRMLAGDPLVRKNMGTPEARAITWNCIDFNGPAEPQTSCFANTKCPNGLRAQVFFPGCWDGKNLDSPNHKSHVAYPDGVDNGRCPTTHPIHMISIFYEVYFDVARFNAVNDGGRFVLSTGDPTGCSLHGDFMNGWDNDVLSRAVKKCTNLSGVIEDCPVFKDEGRFYADADSNACSAPNPFPDEEVLPGKMLPHLPGCVAVTDGPGPASPANLVPGCKAVGVGGSGGTTPSVGVPTLASSSAPTTPSAALPANAVVAHPSVPSASTSQPASPSEVPHPSSSKPEGAKSSPPTSPSPATPNTSPTGHDDGSKPPAGTPVPSAPPSSYKAKGHPKHYHHHGEEGSCGCPAHSVQPSSSMAPHRRHHVKRDNGSPMYF